MPTPSLKSRISSVKNEIVLLSKKLHQLKSELKTLSRDQESLDEQAQNRTGNDQEDAIRREIENVQHQLKAKEQESKRLKKA